MTFVTCKYTQSALVLVFARLRGSVADVSGKIVEQGHARAEPHILPFMPPVPCQRCTIGIIVFSDRQRFAERACVEGETEWGSLPTGLQKSKHLFQSSLKQNHLGLQQHDCWIRQHSRQEFPATLASAEA